MSRTPPSGAVVSVPQGLPDPRPLPLPPHCRLPSPFTRRTEGLAQPHPFGPFGPLRRLGGPPSALQNGEGSLGGRRQGPCHCTVWVRVTVRPGPGRAPCGLWATGPRIRRGAGGGGLSIGRGFGGGERVSLWESAPPTPHPPWVGTRRPWHSACPERAQHSTTQCSAGGLGAGIQRRRACLTESIQHCPPQSEGCGIDAPLTIPARMPRDDGVVSLVHPLGGGCLSISRPRPTVAHALGVWGAVTGHGLGALEGGGADPPLPTHSSPPPLPPGQSLRNQIVFC